MALKRTELSRGTGLKRKPSTLKRTPLGHASKAQKEKVLREGLRIAPVDGWPTEAIDAAHICPRAIGGCDSEDCIIPLTRHQHRLYDEGKLDILPYLSRAEQSHVVGHLGILSALKRTTGETYVPECKGDENCRCRRCLAYDQSSEM